jgi:hypothetical protein
MPQNDAYFHTTKQLVSTCFEVRFKFSEMNTLKVGLIILFSMILNVLDAQNYGQGNRYDRDRFRRTSRSCSEPHAQKIFNRDYSGIANSNLYHLDNSVRQYTKFRCLTSEQIRRLTLLYPTDREKYDYLVWAFNYTFDIENFALTGAVMSNRSAREAFYRFLVREGIPAGDYYNDYSDPYRNGGLAYGNVYAAPPVPQYSRDANLYNNYPDPRYPQAPTPDGSYGPQTPPQSQFGINAGYRGALTYEEFAVLKERIAQNTFDKRKLETARTLTSQNTFTANQIMEIARMFSFEDNRLEYAKFAYQFAFDKANFEVVKEALSFEKSKHELQKFIESKP